MSFIEKLKLEEGKNFAKKMIQEYIKNNKLTFEEFIKQNPDYKTFEKNTRGKKFDYANIIRNHGIMMDEKLYNEITQDIKKDEDHKKDINVDVETTNLNGHEISTVTDLKTGEQKIFDNTVSNKTIEEQMKTVQEEHQQFQDEKDNNTLNLMNYMGDNIKITPDTTDVKDLSTNMFNKEETDKINIAKDFEKDIGEPVNLDINHGFLYTKNRTFSINKRNNSYYVTEGEVINNPKSKVHTLTNKLPMNEKRANNE